MAHGSDGVAGELERGQPTAGGPGGPGASTGGAGAKGRVRIDADRLTGPGATGNASWGSFKRGFVGRITAYSYDADLRPVDTVQGADDQVAASAGLPSSDGGANVRTRQVYDADGHVAARYEPRAFMPSTTAPDDSLMMHTDYDQDGRPTAQYVPRYGSGNYADPGLSQTQTGQCPTNPSPQAVPGVHSFPSGVGVCVTRAQYDAAGNLSRMVLPTSSGSDNRYVARAYTDDNLLQSVDAPSPDPNSGARVTAAAYLYDGVGKQVKAAYPLGRQQTTTYFPDELVQTVGNLSTSATPPVTSYTIDGNGNRTSVTDPVGNQNTSSYFTDNLVNATVVGANDPAVSNRTTHVYDLGGNPTQVFSPSANAGDANNTAATPETNSYTFDNRLLTSTVPVSPDGTQRRQTTYGYDRGGRKTSQHVVLANFSSGGAGGSFSGVNQDGGTQALAYYGDDRLSSQTGRTGNVIAKQYDAAGNPTSITDNSVGVASIDSTFYLDGLPRTVDDHAFMSKYAYDGAGQPAARADSVDNSSTRYLTSYTYGDAELAATMSSDVLQGGRTTQAYDQAGRPTVEKQQDPSGATLREQTTRTYNGDDTLATQSLSNAGGGTLASWSYLYDAALRVTDQTYSGSGPNQDHFHFNYDAASRVSQWTYNNGAAAVPLSWDHDGNRTRFGNAAPYNTVATYNADNSVRTLDDGSGAQSSSYVAFGGLSNDGCHNYSYDGFDRLHQVSATARCPGTSVISTYDGLDRLKTRTESGVAQMHYDGLSSQVAVETNSGVDTAYELDPSGRRLALSVNPTSPSAHHYLSDDGHGDIASATTTSASVACSVRFDPFGSPIAGQSGTNPCNAGSTPDQYFWRGSRRDSTTGDYQFGTRVYDPAKASFLTPDAYRAGDSARDLGIGTDPLTSNRYSGLNGDPVNLSDANGHKPTTGLEEASACDANPGCRSQSEQRSGVGSGATCLQGGLAFLQPANCAGPPPGQFKYCAPTDPNQVSCLLGRPSGTQPQVRIMPKSPPRTQDQVLASCFIAGMSLNAGDPEVAATGNPSLPIIRDIKRGNGTCALARGLGMLSLAVGVLAPEEDAAVAAIEGGAARGTAAVGGESADAIGVGTSEGGYSSFSAAKNALGSPGSGNVYDHVVEQSQMGRSGFSAQQIHNPENLNPVPSRLNQVKANYYSSKQFFTGNGTVRDWLSGQSFEDQWTFGMDTTQQIFSGEIPGYVGWAG